MRHILVSTSARHDLADELRASSSPSTTFVSARGVEETLERLGRSYRVDAVVTDDPLVLTEIFHDVPGGLPVYLAREDEPVDEILKGLDEMVTS